MKVEDKVIKIIDSIIDKQINVVINHNTNLMLELGMDSIQIMQLIVEVENEFNFEIDDDDLNMEKLSILKNIIDIIEKHIIN